MSKAWIGWLLLFFAILLFTSYADAQEGDEALCTVEQVHGVLTEAIAMLA